MKTNEKKVKPGFVLRLCQVLCVLNMVTAVIVFTIMNKGFFDLTPSVALYIFDVVASVVEFWLIWQRKRIARPLVITVSTINIVGGVIRNLAFGSFSIQTQLLESCLEILMILLFLFSKRVRLVLDQPMNLKENEMSHIVNHNYFRPKESAFWRNIVMYFCFFSVAGHWMEAGYCLLIKWGIMPGKYDPTSQIWSDWLFPFCVYGVGAVFCIAVFYPIRMSLEKKFKHKIIPILLSFLISMAVCSGIELTMGLIMNQPVNGVYPLWDYTDHAVNFLGQICLENAIGFGLVATLITWVVYPLLEGLLSRIPRGIAEIIAIAWIALFAILFIFYCTNVLSTEMIDEIKQVMESSSQSLVS